MLTTSPQASAIENVVYGKVHVSLDMVQTGYGSHNALASNSSTIGVKGSDSLGDWGMALWRLESDIDVSGERGYLQTRTRYAGIATQAGSLTFGAHDTPWKALGRKFDIYGDTIFDARALLGAGEPVMLDRDAVNSVHYKSPWWEDFQLDVVHSLGEEKVIDGTDTTAMTGISIVLKKEIFSLGAAFDRQDLFKSEAWRGTGVVRYGPVKVGGLYERLQSSLISQLNHEALGGNIIYIFAPGYSLQTQGSGILNASAKKFVAVMINAGITFAPTKSLQIYAVGGQMFNDANSGYMLGLSGHGEIYPIVQAGYDPYAMSLGMVVKF